MRTLTKKDLIEVIPIVATMVMCIYWIVTGDKVSSDPYLLGLFRGIIWPTVFMFYLRSIVLK
jgi:hypothetical protein